MEMNQRPDHEEQINPNYRHTTVETDTEESENETVTDNQPEEEEEDISRLQNPEQERVHQTQSWFSWETTKKVGVWVGGGAVAVGSVFTVVSYYGYSVLWKRALLSAGGKVLAKHLLGTPILVAAKKAMAGIKMLSSTSLMTGVASIPLLGWIAIVAGAVVLIGGSYLVYQNWDKITSWFSHTWNNVKSWFGWKKPAERVVERVLAEPITENIAAPYLFQETEPEREIRNLSHTISGLQITMDNFQTNMQDLIERRSEIGTTIFEEQQQELERQLAETKTQLTELQARYDKFPEEIRRSSAAKAEQIQQFQNHLTQGATYFFLFLIIFTLVLVGKKIRKFLGLTKKKSEETLIKIQERVEAMNAELQVQKVAQALEQISRERLSRKTKKIKEEKLDLEELHVDEQPERFSSSRKRSGKN